MVYASSPEAQPADQTDSRLPRGRLGVDLRQDLVAEGGQLVALAEEVGLVGGDAVDDLLQLELARLRIARAQVAVVLGEVDQRQRLEARLQPAVHDVGVVVGEEDAAVVVDEIAQEAEDLGRQPPLADRGDHHRSPRAPASAESIAGQHQRILLRGARCA